MSTPNEADGLRVRALVLRQSVTVFETLTALGRMVDQEATHQILCPNPQHPERRPSARVYAESNHVHCFVCGRTWDVVGLVMVVRGCGFAEAVTWMEVAFGIEALDGLTMVEALADLVPRRDLSQRFREVEQRIQQAKPTLTANRYHRLWLALDGLRESMDGGRVTLDEADQSLTMVEDACTRAD